MGLKSDCSLIVVDHGVPGGIKGMEFISMAHERWPGLPAILTSGYQLDASQVTHLSLTCSNHGQLTSSLKLLTRRSALQVFLEFCPHRPTITLVSAAGCLELHRPPAVHLALGGASRSDCPSPDIPCEVYGSLDCRALQDRASTALLIS